jgi:Protein of unknown function (DUF2442)
MTKTTDHKLDEYAIATARGELNHLIHPIAIAANYQPETGLIEIIFSNETRFAFPAHLGQGLEGATPADLADIEITPSGTGLHWESIDADLYIPALLEGIGGALDLWLSIGQSIDCWMFQVGQPQIDNTTRASSDHANG